MAAGICPLVAVQILCAGLCGFAPWCEATFFVQRRGDAKKGESFRVKGGRLLEKSEGLRQMSGRLRLRRVSTGTRFLWKAIPFVGKAMNDVGKATNDVGKAANDVGNAIQLFPASALPYSVSTNDLGFHAKTPYFR